MSWLLPAEPPIRPIDAVVGELVSRRWPQVPEAVLRLFTAASLATGQGDSAFDPGAIVDPAALGLPDWPRDRWLQMLVDCPAVGTANDLRPFVLDEGLLYLRRFHRDEVRLADGLRKLAMPAAIDASRARIGAALDRLFPDVADLVGNRQARACVLSLASRFTVVLGGPGTGKTTTVLRLLALHQSLSDRPLKISVCAPTGKAAARVAEAMQAAVGRLDIDASMRSSLPARAMTLHRLLGAHADGASFRHDAGNPLDCDLVVLDEASMVDLGLFARLVDALPGHARLVVLGDPDQLEAIESGAVLSELSRIADRPAEDRAIRRVRACIGDLPGSASDDDGPAVGACVVRLVQGWRFSSGSGIGQLSAAVCAGDAGAAIAVLQSGAGDVVHVPSISAAMGSVQSFVTSRYAMAMASRSPTAMLGTHSEFRVLAATRADVARANAAATAAVGQRGRGILVDSGLPFLVERNDALRQLHNGDTGVFAPDDLGDMRAWLLPGAGSDGLRALAPHEIGRWHAAYALTVHRAQGSEYDDVMVMLPQRDVPLASRSWLYTAITRARRQLVLVGDPARLAEVMSRVTARTSGLAARLRTASN